jgi:hypothetical protein
VLVVGEPGLGCERIVGRIKPPQVRRGYLGNVEFGLREPGGFSGRVEGAMGSNQTVARAWYGDVGRQSAGSAAQS